MVYQRPNGCPLHNEVEGICHGNVTMIILRVSKEKSQSCTTAQSVECIIPKFLKQLFSFSVFKVKQQHLYGTAAQGRQLRHFETHARYLRERLVRPYVRGVRSN